MKIRRVTLSMVLLLMCIVLSACSSTEGTYKKAQDLLAKEKYAQAAEKFESLGSYEDASTLAMYCKACALCEEGSFETGIAGFESLGDFKDCAYRIIYYTARSWDDSSVNTTEYEWMERSKEIYQENPLYLDSAERIAALNTRIEKAKSTLYNEAVAAADSGNYATARSIFDRLDTYKDSSKRYTYYDIRADEDKLGATTDQDDVLLIAIRYINAGEFLDSTQRTEAMYAKADAIVADKYAAITALINEGKYAEAEAALASFGAYGDDQVPANYYAIGEKYAAQSQWDEASAAFTKAGEYSDAQSRVTYCGIRKAEDALENTSDVAAIQAAAVQYTDMGAYLDCTDRAAALNDRATAILDGKYDAAVALMNEGKYEDAYEAFSTLNGYMDSTEQALLAYQQHKLPELKRASVGSYITFGAYEQDANTGNGKEDIEWLVLTKENSRLLVVSKYALFCQDYESMALYATWESCNERNWLNNYFFNSVFSSAEKTLIPTVMVTADKNPKYSNINPGNATQDKVFLLSISEVNKYFASDSARVCNTTTYANHMSAVTNDNGACWWRLRSPGHDRSYTAHVGFDGKVDEYGSSIDHSQIAVRPALWINLEP